MLYMYGVNRFQFLYQVIAFFLFLSGPLFLILGIHFHFKARDFKKTAIRTRGTIIELVSKSTKAGSLAYAPVVSFADEKGVIFTFTSVEFRRSKHYQIGKSIDILYDPSKPSKALLDTVDSIWGGGFFFLIIGCMGILLGSYYFFGGR